MCVGAVSARRTKMARLGGHEGHLGVGGAARLGFYRDELLAPAPRTRIWAQRWPTTLHTLHAHARSAQTCANLNVVAMGRALLSGQCTNPEMLATPAHIIKLEHVVGGAAQAKVGRFHNAKAVPSSSLAEFPATEDPCGALVALCCWVAQRTGTSHEARLAHRLCATVCWHTCRFGGHI